MSRDPNELKVFVMADALVLDIYRTTRDFPVDERSTRLGFVSESMGHSLAERMAEVLRMLQGLTTSAARLLGPRTED